jgi:lipocalin
MFRMRYRSDVDRWCLIQYQGRWYQIQSLNGDYHTNQLQITATELANQNVNIVEPTPTPDPDPTPTPDEETTEEEEVNP